MALTTGALAAQSQVNLQTIRFYEREGLLPPAPRTASGYRAFPPTAVARVRFIRRAQELGFALTEIRELLSLRVDKSRDREDVRAIAAGKLAEIDGKIQSLQTIRQALAHLADCCTGHGPADECPILVALNPNPDSQQTLF